MEYMEKFSFKYSVINVVKNIPKGKVASYGQVALYIGAPRAARQVGYVLNKNSDVSVPWWRVVNNAGRVSIKGSEFSAIDQRTLLRSEGVKVTEDFIFDIEKYRYRPSEAKINSFMQFKSLAPGLKEKLPLKTARG
jgi:methylated-DNA-protein-cysteine methyltransferase-like protein